MTLTTLLEQIQKDDIDLLCKSDEWLENERRIKAELAHKSICELQSVMLVQRIKRMLQQKNLVAMQQIVRDDKDSIQDIIVRIVNLPDALAMVSQSTDTLDEANFAAQLSGWEDDGYDLEKSAKLR